MELHAHVELCLPEALSQVYVQFPQILHRPQPLDFHHECLVVRLPQNVELLVCDLLQFLLAGAPVEGLDRKRLEAIAEGKIGNDLEGSVVSVALESLVEDTTPEYADRLVSDHDPLIFLMGLFLEGNALLL